MIFFFFLPRHTCIEVRPGTSPTIVLHVHIFRFIRVLLFCVQYRVGSSRVFVCVSHSLSEGTRTRSKKKIRHMSEWMVCMSIESVHCMYSINIRGMCLVVIGDTKLKCTLRSHFISFLCCIFFFFVRSVFSCVLLRSVSFAATFSIECTPHSIPR